MITMITIVPKLMNMRYSSGVWGLKTGVPDPAESGGRGWMPGRVADANLGDPPCQLLREGVFDFLAGLLEVALGLVAAAFGFERLVAGDLPAPSLTLPVAFSPVFLALSSALIVLSPCLPAMARPPGFRRRGGTCHDDAGYG
jgi:hypothetical protein